MNQIIIHGRLTRDPETKFFDGDKTMTKLSVAVDRSFKDKDGNKVTDFFNCVSFNKQAEIIDKYFKKGDGITVSGEMQNNTYTDREGKKRDGWQIRIDKFDFELSRKEQTGETRNDSSENGFSQTDDSTDEEDLPF